MPSKIGKVDSAVGYTGNAYVIDESKDVLEAARERVAYCLDHSDTYIVSFSGGKDSSCAFHLSYQEAQKRGKVLKVAMFDEEVIDPDTIEYCDRVRNLPGVEFYWFCVPIVHTLRSQIRDHWITWDPIFKDVWARDMPAGAITTEDFKSYELSMTISDALGMYFPKDKYGKVIISGGIRIQESLNRRRAMRNAGTFLTDRGYGLWAKPVWDWKWEDVWRFLGQSGADHSRYYDRLWMKGVSPHNQRVAPWGNVAASREAKYYPEFYPDFWNRVVIRLPELLAQSRYGDSKLFKKILAKPLGATWQEYCFQLINEFESADVKAFWLKVVRQRVNRWARKTTTPFPDEPMKFDERNSDSWRSICQSVQKNDLIKVGNGFDSRDRN